MFLLPSPKEVKVKDGYFILLPKAKIVLDASCNNSDMESARLLKEEIFQDVKLNLPITKSFKIEENSIYLKKREGKNESYEIFVKENIIEIIGADDAGLFYGVQTLRQIIRSEGMEISQLYIKDEPYFANRGFYHDVSRGCVPTLDTLKELVDRAAFYKINQIQLYIEHTFAFKNFSEVWAGADPLTAEDILELDEYCIKRHIELVPSLSSFGHMYMILSSKSYSNLCELENSDDADKPYSWIGRMLHHTLDVSNPESIEFVGEMLDEFIPLFSSDKFNICGDETFDLGEGKNKELAEKIGKGQLYITFLNKIVDTVKKYDKKVMFWGDVVLNHPEVFEQIPKDIICLNWDYSAEPEEDRIKAIADTGLTQYVCPGVGGWNHLMNDFDSSYSNIKNMVNYGKKYNAAGVLNTNWGDYGNINLLGNSIPGMIYGASLSWNPDYNKDFSTVDKEISTIEYGDQTGSLVNILREISRQQIVDHFQITCWKENKFIGFPKISIEQKKEHFDIPDEKLINAHDRVLELQNELLKISRGISPKYSKDIGEFCISARGIALYDALALIIKKYDLGLEDTKLIYAPSQLAPLFEVWLADYMRAWRNRNKESELYRIRGFITHICSYLRSIGE
jgi:hypothetical protein